jgi:hypothetical protein
MFVKAPQQTSLQPHLFKVLIPNVLRMHSVPWKAKGRGGGWEIVGRRREKTMVYRKTVIYRLFLNIMFTAS